MTKRVVASGGMALLLAAGAGLGAGMASAQPNVDTIVNSTCSYPQVIAALNADSPKLAKQFEAAPAATGWLKSLIAASPDKRRSMVAQAQAMPGMNQYTPVIMRVASSCSNF